MTKDDFVALCKELIELGAEHIHADAAGNFHASFHVPQAAVPVPVRREEPHGPPRPRSSEEERRAFYGRVMGDPREG